MTKRGCRLTTDLIKSIKALADSLARDLMVQWYQTEFALKAFKAGIEVFLRQHDAGETRISIRRFMVTPMMPHTTLLDKRTRD